VKLKHCASVVLFCFVLASASAFAGGTGAAPSSNTARIPSGAALVKRAIVSLPHSEADEDAVLGLMLLFDSWNSDESLRVLASFSSYYLGEASGGLYDCLVLRKGKAIRPYLEQVLRSNSDECMAEFGARSRGNCEDSRRKERIRNLLSRIDSGERCSNEELENTWGY